MIKEKQDNREFMKNAGRRDRILAELKERFPYYQPEEAACGYYSFG